ncbi:MAG: apolipoprotein N-acyltransferase, partial [Verrucomicrobiales bacterium]|nr:apolipoprotein N-acyltransferase [Verrucomicrobiales bacterium]
LSASLPKFQISGFAWVAPALFLASAFAVSSGQAFRIGFAAGFAFQLATLYWLLLIPFPLAPVLGWLGLSAYLALYPATWVWFCWKLFPTELPRMNATVSLRTALDSFLASNFIQRQLWCLCCAMAWVALEMVQARFLSGFPWNFLGVSQYRNLPIIQVASVAGVYGVSFLLAWFSAALLCTGLMMLARPTAPRQWRAELLVPLLAVIGVTVFGARKIMGRSGAEQTLRIALVQPSIPQRLIWDSKENSNRFTQLLQLSEQALASKPKPQLLIWPEAAVPNLLRYEPEIYQAITNLAVTTQSWMIIGADDALPRADAVDERELDYFNSSFLIGPGGELKAVYRKRRLVVFGEYTPLARWIPLLRRLLPAGEGFRAGHTSVPFRIPDLQVTTSVLICFEDTFPHLARIDVGPETDFLLNLTNNGWFGESAAQWQHAAIAQFRAVENGLPLVRCANNGLTCWVDSIGAIHDVHFSEAKESGDIYRAGFKIVQVPLLPEGTERPPTFYNRFGDWFGWVCVMLTATLLVARVAPQIRSSPKRG